jgi:hypothetical protein
MMVLKYSVRIERQADRRNHVFVRARRAHQLRRGQQRIAQQQRDNHYDAQP